MKFNNKVLNDNSKNQIKYDIELNNDSLILLLIINIKKVG